MPANFPPLPDDFKKQSPDQSSTYSAPSAFSGGLPSMMQAMQMIEAGYQKLGQSLPSLLPLCAERVSELRSVVPTAMSAGAGASTPPQMGLQPDLTPPPSPPPPQAQGQF